MLIKYNFIFKWKLTYVIRRFVYLKLTNLKNLYLYDLHNDVQVLIKKYISLTNRTK